MSCGRRGPGQVCMTCAVIWSDDGLEPKGSRKGGRRCDTRCAQQRHSPPEAAEHSSCIPHTRKPPFFNSRHRMQDGAAPKKKPPYDPASSCVGKMPENLVSGIKHSLNALTNERNTHAQHSRRHTRQHIHCTSTASATHALDSRSGSSISRRARSHQAGTSHDQHLTNHLRALLRFAIIMLIHVWWQRCASHNRSAASFP